MAKPAAAAALVKDLYFERAEHIADIDDYPVGDGVLDEAIVHGDDLMAPRLVNAGDDIAPPVKPEGRADLCPVAQRLLHADDVLNVAELAQKGDELPLLMAELLLIAHVPQLAAAAFSEIFTRFFLLFHRFTSKILLVSS